MRYKVTAFLNDGEGRFFGFDPGDILDRGPTMTVDAPEKMAALDKVFEIGNLDTPDALGVRYPHDKFRSISVSDVLAVADVEDAATASYFACDRVGWSPLTPDEFSRAVAFGKAKHEHRENEPVDHHGCRACGVEPIGGRRG